MLSMSDSVCVTGEVGIGKTHLAGLIGAKLKCAYGIYRGDNTKCLQGIAEYLGVSLSKTIERNNFDDEDDSDSDEENTSGRRRRRKPRKKKESEPKIKLLTAKELKVEIAENLGDTVLICDRFHRWPASLKGWVDDLYENGATLLLLGNHRDLEDMTYKIPRLELAPLTDKQIRKIILRNIKSTALKITTTELSEMAARAGGNPLIAKRLVKELKQDINSKNTQDGNNYRDVTPFLMVIFGLVGAVRFVGMASGNLQLRILGGLAITLLFSLKSLKGLFSRGSRR